MPGSNLWPLFLFCCLGAKKEKLAAILLCAVFRTTAQYVHSSIPVCPHYIFFFFRRKRGSSTSLHIFSFPRKSPFFPPFPYFRLFLKSAQPIEIIARDNKEEKDRDFANDASRRSYRQKNLGIPRFFETQTRRRFKKSKQKKGANVYAYSYSPLFALLVSIEDASLLSPVCLRHFLPLSLLLYDTRHGLAECTPYAHLRSFARHPLLSQRNV